jgi:hypothetical protein
LIDRPLASDERISLITHIFSDRDETKAIKCLCGDDAQSFVDVVDKVFPLSFVNRSGDLELTFVPQVLDMLAPQLRRTCLGVLRKICGRQALFPRSVQIPLCYNREDNPLYRGGYADVWKGEYNGCDVAVKVLRVYSTSDFGKIASVGSRDLPMSVYASADVYNYRCFAKRL